MSDTDMDVDMDRVDYEPEQFEETDAVSVADGLDTDLRRVAEVPLELSVEIGRTQMTVGETLDLRAGSIVTLDRLAGEPVDLLVNGTPIARGEVVVVDEQFGLRVIGILDGEGESAADEQTPVEAQGSESGEPA
ncbi:MAG TPA: flagellar motor switch protein FliN [Solirubrobacteraceae bacterium]|jgi:flagellar motor switch protein FliN/FliY|nr:flagellar motor switch protein FliN [Solirubrobacteraceae bacterium]